MQDIFRVLTKSQLILMVALYKEIFFSLIHLRHFFQKAILSFYAHNLPNLNESRDVFLILLSRYGFRDSGILLVPVAFGILFALAAVSWMGNPVTLFNVMALILVLGIGVDYSIFLREGGEEETPAFLGVLLAAAATLLSFGFLSFSTMPALRSFGITLVVGVFISLVLAPLVVTFRREKNR